MYRVHQLCRLVSPEAAKEELAAAKEKSTPQGLGFRV